MTFADFKTYFEANQTRFADLAWDDPHQLSPAERRAVRHSLQAFQRGESSEGHYLQARAEQLHDPEYPAAIALFIQEEASHAAVLGRFMDQQGIARLSGHWADGVFRVLRRVLALEHTLRVVLAAEVVAAVYYRALFNATYSGLLQQICRRIGLDEEMHLNFQCFAIRQLSAGRPRVGEWLYKQAYRVLMAGATLVAYAASRRALRAGGFGFTGFCSAVATEYARVERMQQPNALIAVRGGQPPAPAAAGPAGGLAMAQPGAARGMISGSREVRAEGDLKNNSNMLKTLLTGFFPPPPLGTRLWLTLAALAAGVANLALRRELWPSTPGACLLIGLATWLLGLALLPQLAWWGWPPWRRACAGPGWLRLLATVGFFSLACLGLGGWLLVLAGGPWAVARLGSEARP